MTKAASQADVVVNAADLNDLALVTALIDGLAQRTLATGRRAILLHTSGAFVAFDDAEGTANPHPEYINVRPNPDTLQTLFTLCRMQARVTSSRSLQPPCIAMLT